MKLEFSIFVKKHLISSMAGFQSPITIAQAIERIHRNEYLLPAFQRDFVWSAEQIEKLFDSLMKGYPISSMLFWKVKVIISANRYHFYHSNSTISITQSVPKLSVNQYHS